MSLEEKLKEILNNDDLLNSYPVDGEPDVEAIAQIIQAFKEDGWVTPEEKIRVQEMVTNLANLANAAVQLPTIQYVKVNKTATKSQNLMSGQEWYERFMEYFPVTVDPRIRGW